MPDLCGVQVAAHAIGDRGNQRVLDDYAAVLGDAARSDRRWRIEHAQAVSVDDIPMFERLHVVTSMQPTHATLDMPWADGVPVHAALAGAHDVAGATAATH